ncbi:diguanylate cyclase [Rhizobium sp. G187]|uniref:diguanylate cyclase n=1 Tax=Rhizobium sp. G187 TaxID=3451352 RepID=UPI003EE75500
MEAVWNHVLANCAIILFTILAWTNVPQGRARKPFVERIKLGFFFGFGTLLVMARPIEFEQGIYIDLRTITLSIAGLVGGWPGALVAAVMAGAFRLWLGGVGASAGVAIIILAASIGVAGAWWLAGRLATYRELLTFSALICLGNLVVLLIMPQNHLTEALHQAAGIWIGTVFVTTFLSSMAVFAELRRRDFAKTLKMYEAVIRSLPESMNVKDPDGRFVMVNPATAKLMRVASEQDLIGKTDHDFYPPEIADTFRADELDVLAGNDAKTVEQIIVWPDSGEITLSTLKAALRDDEGMLIGLITHNRDLTEKKELASALAESEKRANAALSNMADGLIMFDAEMKVIFCNEQYRAMFPLTADMRVPGIPARQILEAAMERGEITGIPPVEAKSFIDNAMSRLRQPGTVQFPLADGRWVESRTTPSENGGCLVVCSDITRAKRDEQELRDLNEKLAEMAMTDSLTELLNRRAFDTALATEMTRCIGTDAGLSILLIDVDRFKAYNDTYGHTSGDDCLRQVAMAVRSVARRPGDRAARYGGEEMALILPNTREEAAIAMAHDLRMRIRALEIPHTGSEKGVVTVSIGVATIGKLARQVPSTQFINRADEALYRAKASGRDAVRAWEEEAVVEQSSAGGSKR